VKGEATCGKAFQDLDACVDNANREAWREEEEKAMTHRGEYLRIYDVRLDKGMSWSIWSIEACLILSIIAPSLADIRLKLMQNDEDVRVLAGNIAWLSEGINLEKAQ
jgi:hypothetical protein